MHLVSFFYIIKKHKYTLIKISWGLDLHQIVLACMKEKLSSAGNMQSSAPIIIWKHPDSPVKYKINTWNLSVCAHKSEQGACTQVSMKWWHTHSCIHLGQGYNRSNKLSNKCRSCSQFRRKPVGVYTDLKVHIHTVTLVFTYQGSGQAVFTCYNLSTCLLQGT